MKTIVARKLGWVMGSAGSFWFISSGDGHCEHVGTEKYIRKVWSQYRECENMAGEKVLGRRI